MNKTLKTEEAFNAFQVLGTAKYSKLEDADKIKVWKITRRLKQVSSQFDADSKDAAEKFKPEGNFDEMLEKAREYERIKSNGNDQSPLPISDEEYADFLKKFREYNRIVGDAIKEFADKEVELEYEPLTEEAFGKLMASNEWTMAQADIVADVVTG